MEKEEDSSNVVTISGRGIEVYEHTILNKLQYNDQIEIHCLSRYILLAQEIIMRFAAVGIVPEKNEYNPKGKIMFVTKEEELESKDKWQDEEGKFHYRKTGETYNQPVHRITLTKQPDQFRFTQIK